MLLTDNNYYLNNEPVLRLYKDDKLVFPERNYPVTLTIDTSKTAPTNQFFIPVPANTVYNFIVNWGDSVVESLTATNTTAFTHTYPVSNQLYNVYISGAPLSGFSQILFNNNIDVRNKLIKVTINNDNHFTSMANAFNGCSNLKKITAGVFPSAENFSSGWFNCSSLTEFPVISSLRGTNFAGAWRGCTNLRSFPLLEIPDTATGFGAAWSGCSSLTSFPALNFKNVTSLLGIPLGTWANCTDLTTFPIISCPNVTTVRAGWSGCTSLKEFPPISFPRCTSFNTAWINCRSMVTFSVTEFLSSANDFASAWGNCVSLTSFPALNFQSATSLTNAWFGCSSLNTFPLITCDKVTNLLQTWSGCSSLTSFPPISFINVTSFNSTWRDCVSLSAFEFNIDTFSKVTGTGGTNCFLNVTLPTQTWSSILTSISATNTNLNVTFHGGNSKRNAAGTTAYAHLTGRGWTITDGGPE
jgi:hypothetical protein